MEAIDTIGMPLFVIEIIKLVVIMAAVLYLAPIDFKKHIVPNKILIYLLIGRGVIAIPELYFALTYNETASLELFLSDIAAALFFGVFFLVSFLITKGGLGMGDVKYIIIAGLYAGMPITFLAIIIGLTLSFFISIYALSTKKLERTSALPMIPFLAAGQVLATILNISGIVG